MEHENDCNTNSNWCTWYSHYRIGTGIGRLGNKRTRGNHPNHSIVEISLNTKKSHGDLRRLLVSQNPVETLQLNAGVKNFQMLKIMILIIIRYLKNEKKGRP